MHITFQAYFSKFTTFRIKGDTEVQSYMIKIPEHEAPLDFRHICFLSNPERENIYASFIAALGRWEE